LQNKQSIMKANKILAMAALALCSCATNAQKPASSNLNMLVGTFTDGSTSKGIYLYQFNQETGLAGKTAVLGRIDQPTYVTASLDGRHIYTVVEKGDGTQGVSAFARTRKGGTALRLIGTQSTMDKKAAEENNKGNNDGSGPCFIFTNEKQIITANYGGGDISVFPINKKTGGIEPLSQHFCFKPEADGTVSHIHCVRMTPDRKYLIATDLGKDCIYRFNIDNTADFSNKRPLLTNCTVIYRGEHGLGPRHITFSRNGKFAYLINELGGALIVFAYHDGELQMVQRIQADEGGGHGSADVHISPDGNFVYTSHRLKKDGVAIFKIDPDNGLVTKVGYQETGIHPRNFNITPNGKYVLVACRDTNEIQVFQRDARTGLLTDTHHPIKIGKPACVKFIK
jgi:6-phosphogluconolactonase